MSSQASVTLDRPDEVRARSGASGPVAALTRAALGRLLRRLIRTGSLTVVLPSGEALHAGGRRDDAIAAFRRALALDPQAASPRAWLQRLGAGAT